MVNNDLLVRLDQKIGRLDPRETIISGGIALELLVKIEQRLMVQFPRSYKYFLQAYGNIEYVGSTVFGAVEGVEINYQPVVMFTEELRQDCNLPIGYIPMYEWDADIYMLDTSRTHVSECPVVLGAVDSHDKSSVIIRDYAPNFTQFLELILFEP